eukprot:106065_1
MYNWPVLLPLVYINVFYPTESSDPYWKSTLLTPSNASQHGAVVGILHNDAYVNTNNNVWTINTTTQIGYPMSVSMNSSWGFHSNLTSTIQFTIDSTTNISPYDLDLSISFSINKQQFISMAIRLDNKNDTRIYPNCSTRNAVSIQSGDVTALVNAPYGHARFTKAMGNTVGYPMLPHDPFSNNHLNRFPLIFKLTNNPIQNKLYLSLTNPEWLNNHNNYSQHCVYTSFKTGQGLDVYFGLDDIGEIMDITSIEIKYYYDNPTTQPTFFPSIQPSYFPTFLPSNNPSQI